MKKIIYYFWTLAAIFIFTSCGNDNYDAPAETFQGAFIDKDTIEKINKAEGGKIDTKAFNEGKLILVDNFFYDNNKNYDFSDEKLTFRNNKNEKIISANIQLLSSNKDIVKFIEDNEVGVPCIYMSESLINKFKNSLALWKA